MVSERGLSRMRMVQAPAAASRDEASVSVPLIEVRNLSKRFGVVHAVDNVSFTVRPGSVTGFLGPNGSGKTTTLRVLLGLVEPSSGQALIGGVPYRQLDDPGRRVGAVLEASGFHPARSARNHLRVLATAGGIGRSRVDEVIELVGLQSDAHRAVGGYSLGMRQRLELARALLGDPGVLILDEPANGLDPQGIAWLRWFMRWFASQGRVVLMSSHLLAEAAQVVDDVVIVSGGRLAVQGRLADLVRSAGTVSVEVRTPDPQRLAGVVQSAGFGARVQPPDLVVISGTTAEQIGPLMAHHGVVVYAMSSSATAAASLEALFFASTEQRGPAYGPGSWLPSDLPGSPGSGYSAGGS